eukprot:Nitzschia sp. Nitz4//scaffold1_size375055//221713//222674//NITZ4_000290-RA/size375055-augustus-gene-0.681-mRNA-1//1//CDS//3329541087//3220//frame0
MTTIRYFIPEDGDEEMYPNVFLAPKPKQQGAPPTLLAVKDAFPLPGHYHFRFKSPLYPGADREKGAMAVWMDVTQDRQPVPTWKNTIVAKVTRLSMEDDDDDDDDFGHHRTPAPAPAPIPAPVPAQRGPPSQSSNVTPSSSGPSVDLFGGGSAAPAATPAPAANLFDSHPPSAPPSGGSLLDFGPAPAAQPTAHSDFLGMTAPAMQQQAPPPQQQAPPQQQRYQPQQAPQSGNYNPYAQQNQPFGDIGSWN